MIKISKQEAFMLRERGRGEDVHISNITNAKHYYMTESKESMKILMKYRKSNTICVRE